MAEYKAESELILGKSDVLLKQRYAFKISKSGNQAFRVKFPVKIRVAKGRDKFGEIPVNIVSENELKIVIQRKLQKGKVHAVELTLLISPEIKKIGGLEILEWGSLELYRIQMVTRPFQVLGFGSSTYHKGRYLFTENLNKDIASNIARFRSSRVELGTGLRIKLTLKLLINTETGGRVTNIHTFGPTTSKRQQTELATPNIKVQHDTNGNPRYYLPHEIGPGKTEKIEISWIVTIAKGWENDIGLGSYRALQIVTSEEGKFTDYLKPSKYWNTENKMVSDIVEVVSDEQLIYDRHRFLFEFTNRKLKYVETGDRKTAHEALVAGEGDCSEFSDLLVTLHRAAGIPSRVVEGVIIEDNNTLEEHAWVEFLTTKGWMATDPTWGIPLSITSQHIEFSHQKIGVESKVFELEFSGPKPKIKYKLSWSEL